MKSRYSPNDVHSHGMPSWRLSIGMASTRESICASASRSSGLVGARVSEQFPKITVVTPCCGEYVQSGSHVTCASKWQWLSMNPGATTRSVASIVRRAEPDSRPTSATFPSAMPTSAVNDGMPEPSATLPFLMSRSYIAPLLSALRSGPLPLAARLPRSERKGKRRAGGGRGRE